MSRSLLASVLLAFALLCLPVQVPASILPALPAEEEEPELLGKKLSAWITQLEEDKETKQRVRAILALDTIGAVKSRKIVPALVKALREDKDELVREKAALAIGRSVNAMLTAARAEKKDELPRYEVFRDALAACMRTDKADKVREASAKALGIIGPDARASASALGLALKDKYPDTVLAAADALRRLGKDAGEAQMDLRDLLADMKAPAQARTDAAFTLGALGSEAREALPTFRETLANSKTPLAVRKAVAESIGKLGRDGADAVGELAAVLTDKELLAKSLGERESPDKEATKQLRLMAVTVLDQLGPDAKASLPALIKGARDQDNYVRCLALHALGRLGKDIEPERKQAIAAILESMDEATIEVRIAAIEALGALGVDGLHTETTEVIKRLKSLAEREGRKPVREAALAAVEKILPKK